MTDPDVEKFKIAMKRPWWISVVAFTHALLASLPMAILFFMVAFIKAAIIVAALTWFFSLGDPKESALLWGGLWGGGIGLLALIAGAVSRYK